MAESYLFCSNQKGFWLDDNFKSVVFGFLLKELEQTSNFIELKSSLKYHLDGFFPSGVLNFDEYLISDFDKKMFIKIIIELKQKIKKNYKKEIPKEVLNTYITDEFIQRKWNYDENKISILRILEFIKRTIEGNLPYDSSTHMNVYNKYLYLD